MAYIKRNKKLHTRISYFFLQIIKKTIEFTTRKILFMLFRKKCRNLLIL